MHIVALLPFKNEAHNLRTYYSGLKGIVDAIVAIDDDSSDGSADLLRKIVNVPIYIENSTKTEDWSVDKLRQQLLDVGREIGGTHFVCLDADETFTGHFRRVAKKVLHQMEPGQKLHMQWLAMWKSVDHYRDDTSVWSNNYKDFIFRDNGEYNFKEAYLCEPRTPGPNNDETLLTLNPKYGAVYHFQFSDFNRFQMKQSWYRCREVIHGKPISAINQKYAITLDDPNAIVTSVENSWKEGIHFPEISYKEDANNWHLKEIKSFFDKHDVEPFKSLDIWHVPQIKKLVNKS